MSLHHSTFLSLPLELRRAIYQHTTSTDTPTIEFFDKPSSTSAPALKSSFTIGCPACRALWNTSRQIRNELVASTAENVNKHGGIAVLVTGKANLADVKRQTPNCLDFKKVKSFHIDLCDNAPSVIPEQLQYFLDHGLGMMGVEVTKSLPNLEMLQLRYQRGVDSWTD